MVNEVPDVSDRLEIVLASGRATSAFLDALAGDVMLTTRIDGASSLTVKVRDEDRSLRAMVDAPDEVKAAMATVDGSTSKPLRFRLAHVGAKGDILTLRFEDALVAALRARSGRFVLRPGSTTFAGFFARLAAEAGVPITTAPACQLVARMQLGRSIGNVRSNSWQAIGDLAAQQGWRAFSDGQRVLVAPDSWLIARGSSSGTGWSADEDNDAVERIDFSITPNAVAHSCEVRVSTLDWRSVPGDAVNVTGAGAANGAWLHAEWTRGLSEDSYSTLKLIRPGLASRPQASLDDLAARRSTQISYDPQTAEVVSVNGTSIFVVPIGGDRQHPVGPCRGPRYARKTFAAVTGVSGDPGAVSATEGAAFKRVPVKVGDVVLLVMTPQGPWIAAIDE